MSRLVNTGDLCGLRSLADPISAFESELLPMPALIESLDPEEDGFLFVSVGTENMFACHGF